MKPEFPQIAPPRVAIETREQVELFAAISTGCIKTVSHLLSQGVPVNSGDEDDDTPLTMAVSRNNLAMVDLLLSRGADINLTGLGGKTPLRVAVDIAAPLEMVQRLLKAGADPLAISYSDAQKKDITDLMATDRAFVGGRTGDENADTILYEVARATNVFTIIEIVKDGNLQKLDQWLKNNDRLDVNTYNRHGETALLHACHMGRTDLAELLWYAGANPSLPHKYDASVTPLKMAEQNENPQSWREIKRYIQLAEEDFRRSATQLSQDMPVMKNVQIKPRIPKNG